MKFFGTCRPEPTEPLPLGWAEAYEGANPFVIQFRGLLEWLKTVRP